MTHMSHSVETLMNALSDMFQSRGPKRKNKEYIGTETGAKRRGRFPFPCHSVIGSDRQSADFGDRTQKC